MIEPFEEKSGFRTRALDKLLMCCSPLAWLGTCVRLIIRALWASRVSVGSLIVAFVVFSTLPQAQDLFIEFKWPPPNYPGLHWGLVHWIWFYMLAFCLWIMPVYFSARLVLQTNAERMGIDTRAKYRAIVVFLPRILGILCFIAITLGIYGAYRNLPRAGAAEEPILAAAKQQLEWVLWASIGLNLALMALFHYLSSLRVLRGLDRVLPPVYRVLCRLLDWLSQPPSRVFHRPSPPPHVSPLADCDEFNLHRNILVSVTFWLIITLIVNIGIIAISPRQALYVLPRANLIPIILGAMVPGFTFLAVLSHRVRHPCILYFIVVLVGITSMTPTWHDVRCVVDGNDPKRRCAQGTEPRQITLAEAIEAWKATNNCTKDDCPRPIIVAAEGGANRAAFVTASVLAHLEEQSTAAGANSDRFSARLFAMSTVSGGGLGAAVFLGALDAEQTGQLKRDPWPTAWNKPWMCNWFGCYPKVEGDHMVQRLGPLSRAVQQVIAGDFLTPVLMALAFHDVWRFESLGMKSRATVLEEAWQDRFKEIVGTRFLEKPLSKIAPAREQKWRPLLIFNGTSVGSGRRIITSSLRSKQIFGNSIDFYELMCERDRSPQGIATDCPCKKLADDWKVPTCDISVATAILNTARFPIVSPPGNIKSPPGNPKEGRADLIQLIVDGGYFENSGSLTAVELADALKGFQLKPFLLQVTNDPESFVEQCGKEAVRYDPDVRRPFGVIRDPIDTVLNSRVARGYHATVAAEKALGKDSYSHIKICPEEESATISADDRQGKDPTIGAGGKYKQLSYSWWLSMPVQQYLHNQLSSERNKASFQLVLETLKRNATRDPK